MRVQLGGYERLSVAEVQVFGGGGAEVRWLVPDHLGTRRIIVDQTGNLANVKRHDYLPFGEELFAPVGSRTTGQGYAGGDGVRQQFTQKERDIETNLDYFGARYYASTQARFTGVDPANYQALLNLREPQSWNAYAYTNNNPLRWVDRDGRGVGDFFKKLGNWLLSDVWGTEEDVQREEDRRRNDLMRNIGSDGGVNIMSPVTGQWVRVYPLQLNRINVWLWSDAIYYWQAQGGGYREMTPVELASVIDMKVYRGGSSFEVKPGEVKIKDGMVQTTHGPSLNLDPEKVKKFGGAYRVKEIPDELQIIQRGKDLRHYEIVPKDPMPLEKFVELLKKVKLGPE